MGKNLAVCVIAPTENVPDQSLLNQSIKKFEPRFNILTPRESRLFGMHALRALVGIGRVDRRLLLFDATIGQPTRDIAFQARGNSNLAAPASLGLWFVRVFPTCWIDDHPPGTDGDLDEASSMVVACFPSPRW